MSKKGSCRWESGKDHLNQIGEKSHALNMFRVGWGEGKTEMAKFPAPEVITLVQTVAPDSDSVASQMCS